MMIEKGKSIFGDLKQVRFPANCRKHLFLLGPPAVGKLTVGKILSKRTNYPLFDNARTVDVASLLFDYGTNEYRAYRDEMRMLFYNKAMTANIKGLISTCCLRHPSNWCYFDCIEKLFNEHGWNTMYFLLTAEKKAIIDRAGSMERKSKNSLNKKPEIEQWFANSPFHSIPQGHLCNLINTTSYSAFDVADQILKLLEKNK